MHNNPHTHKFDTPFSNIIHNTNVWDELFGSSNFYLFIIHNFYLS